jgi:DNA-directed RNA polymerase subunit RPC12/RpoP
MSDFKFSCPNCGQHLSGDVGYAGRQIVCPACKQQIIVPAAPAVAAPTAARSAPVAVVAQPPPGPRPPQKTCGLAIASLICSIGSFIIIPLGFIPGVICGHMAKKKIAATPSLRGGGLAKAGLIVGYVALGLNVLAIAALVAFFGLFATRIRQAASVAQSQSQRSGMRQPGRGAMPAGAESADTLPDGSGWTMKLTGVEMPSSAVAGRIHGKPFKVEKVVWERGWLKFVEGKDVIADREMDVVLFEGDVRRLSGRTFTVPNQTAGVNPRLFLRWKEAGADMPNQATYTDSYALRLEFGALAGGTLPGKIYLCLPDQEKSFLAGTFEAQLKGAR